VKFGEWSGKELFKFLKWSGTYFWFRRRKFISRSAYITIRDAAQFPRPLLSFLRYTNDTVSISVWRAGSMRSTGRRLAHFFVRLQLAGS